MASGSKSSSSRVVLFAAAAGLAAYGTTWVRAVNATIFDHGFKPVVPFLVLFIVFGVLTYLALARALRPDVGLWPLTVLAFAPILTAQYFDRADFQRRLLLLGLFVAASVIYLAAVRPRPSGRNRHSFSPAGFTDGFSPSR